MKSNNLKKVVLLIAIAAVFTTAASRLFFTGMSISAGFSVSPFTWDEWLEYWDEPDECPSHNYVYIRLNNNSSTVALNVTPGTNQRDYISNAHRQQCSNCGHRLERTVHRYVSSTTFIRMSMTSNNHTTAHHRGSSSCRDCGFTGWVRCTWRGSGNPFNCLVCNGWYDSGVEQGPVYPAPSTRPHNW